MRKKIIFLAMALMCLANFSKAENVSISDFTIIVGDTLVVPIELSNTHDNITAFDITVALPDGVTIDVENCELTDRFEAQLEVRQPDPSENVYRLCGISMSGSSISGTSGALINVPVVAAESFRGGIGYIFDTYVVTTDRERIEIAEESFNIAFSIPEGALLGDANGDGKVDISDVLVTVDNVLGKNPDPFVFANADMDQSGVIDISDVLLIVDKILGK